MPDISQDQRDRYCCIGVFDGLDESNTGALEKVLQADQQSDVILCGDRLLKQLNVRSRLDQNSRTSLLGRLSILKKPTIIANTVEELLASFKDGPRDVLLSSKLAAITDLLDDSDHQVETFSERAGIHSILQTVDHSHFSADTYSFLESFKKEFSLQDISSTLDRLRPLKVLVVGDTIIDEYVFCEIMGKSGKFPILASRYLEEERYLGGIGAIANHLMGFCDEVSVITTLGEEKPEEDFVRNSLSPKIKPHFIYKPNSPTTTKRRFVEYKKNKLFEIYNMKKEWEFEGISKQINSLLRELAPKHDMVLVGDFGHGMLGEDTIKTLCSLDQYLALNVQTNAGNNGYNFISQYSRADFIAIDEIEARLEVRDKTRSLESILRDLEQDFHSDRLYVTTGQRGCLCIENSKLTHLPALALDIVDTMGAGDAFFALSAVLTKQNTSARMTGVLSNIAGAISCGIIGNKKPVDRNSVLSFAEAIF